MGPIHIACVKKRTGSKRVYEHASGEGGGKKFVRKEETVKDRGVRLNLRRKTAACGQQNNAHR